MRILMEGAPAGVDTAAVDSVICCVGCVQGVHDLHVWSLASGKHACSCHVTADGEITVAAADAIRQEIEHRLVHMGISPCDHPV